MNQPQLPLDHANVHREWSQWSEDQTLHVAVAYNNPFRRRTVRELANNFKRHMLASPNVALHFGELAYGDRPHECTGDHPGDVKLRTSSEMFFKENILSRVIQTFPSDWKYGCWIDADFGMNRHDWALEAIHQLQMYAFVQLFSSYSDLTGTTALGLGHLPMRVTPGFAFNYIQSGYQLPEGYANGGWRKSGVDMGYYVGDGLPGKPRGVGATGGAWAFTRDAYETCGGMLEVCCLGHGDWFSAFGLVGEEAPDMHIDGYSSDYRNAIYAWQQNAAKLKKNIGYIDNFAVHHFHGSKQKRRYSSRDTILVKHQFTPSSDLKRDYQGIWQLTDNKPAMRDAFRAYFLERFEDSPELYGSEKPLV